MDGLKELRPNKLDSLKIIIISNLGLFQTSCCCTAKLVDCSTTVKQLSHEKI